MDYASTVDFAAPVGNLFVPLLQPSRTKEVVDGLTTESHKPSWRVANSKTVVGKTDDDIPYTLASGKKLETGYLTFPIGARLSRRLAG